MNVIVCLDDNNGLLFNGRRQSRDRAVTADILRLCGGTLRLAPFSGRLFSMPGSEEFLETAGENDWCFAENVPLLPYKDRIRQLVVYRWNTVYPADTFLDLPLTEPSHVTEFAGYSHERITREVYGQ